LEPTRLGRYFKTYYAPNNCVVVVSGAIKTEEVKRLAQKYLEPIPAQPAPPKVHIVEPVQTGERRITVQKEVATPYLMIGYHTPETKHELLRLEYSQFDSFQWQIIPIVCFTGR
jgi:predicted Zn-dependent peptidase